MTRRRVAVTGVGLVTPVGLKVEDSWQNIVAGVSGVSSIHSFDTSAYSTQFSASVRDFDSSEYFSAKEARKMDTFVLSALPRASRRSTMPA